MQSEIRNMSIECDRVNGINLWQGICDMEVPLVVRRGAQEAIDNGINSYTRYDGLDELRKSISYTDERDERMLTDLSKYRITLL